MSGAIKRGWGMAGFSGWKVGECEFGQREDEFIVRLMSDTAANCWRKVYQLADSITRIDLQVTIDMHVDCAPLVWKYYHAANRESEKCKRGPLNRVILGNDGGATLYCGQRTSQRFGRCYAKGPQSKMSYYQTCLRFEVQYNGRMAKLVAHKIAAARSERAFAFERSSSFFRTRIGSFPVRIATIHKDTCPRKRTDVERKLEWLRDSVGPSIRLLRDLGYDKEVYAALGLQGPVGLVPHPGGPSWSNPRKLDRRKADAI